MLARLSRRAVVAGASCLLIGRAAGHTPYRQWDVYRQKHLLIGTCRADPDSYPLGKSLVAILASAVPDSKARVTRAPDQMRLASLVTTGQLELILLKLDEAASLAAGREPFAEFGPYPLRLVFEVEGYALVAGEEFAARHAWLVTGALAEHLPASKVLVASSEPELPMHEGSRSFLAGAPQPD
jgi:hypothetical protein